MNNVKKIALLFIPVTFLFLFLVTADSAEANFGKGWYNTKFPSDPTCPTGFRAQVVIRDTSGASLTVDRLNITIYHSGVSPWPLYKTTQSNVNEFTTPCLSTGSGRLWYYATTEKAGYDDLFSYQWDFAGPFIKERVQRNLYVAKTTESINLQHSFAIDNEIVTSSSVTNKVYYELKPGSKSADIIYKITHLDPDPDTNWTGVVNTGAVNTGTVDLPTNTLPDGRYRWEFWMVDNNGFVYDFPWYENFIVDTVAPTASCSVSLSGTDYLVKLNESDAISEITTSGIDWATVTVEVSEDGGSWTNNGLPNGGTVWWDFNYPSSPGHSYQFRYQVSDRAGWSSGWAICDAPAMFFTIEIDPDFWEVGQDDSYTYQVIVRSENNFAGTVNLTHNDNDTIPGNDLLPDGITLTLGDSSVILLSGGAEFTTLKVDTDPGTPLDTYTLRVTGTTEQPDETTNFDEALLEVVEPASDPWLKTTGGDVGSFFDIDMLRDIFTDESLYNADYLVITKTPPLIVNFDSEEGWEINTYGGLTLDPDPTSSTMYDVLWDKYGGDSQGDRSGATLNQGNMVSTVVSDGGVMRWVGNIDGVNLWNYQGAPAVIFVDGSMTIDADMSMDADTGVIFIVKEDIIVDDDVIEIAGVFITNGVFNSHDTNSCGVASDGYGSDDRLVINGAVHAFGQLCFTRDPGGASNLNTPAELINYEPKYLYLFQEIVGDPTVIYREISP